MLDQIEKILKKFHLQITKKQRNRSFARLIDIFEKNKSNFKDWDIFFALKGAQGLGVLQLAVRYDQLDFVQNLLQMGANLFEIDNKGVTVFSILMQKKQYPLVIPEFSSKVEFTQKIWTEILRCMTLACVEQSLEKITFIRCMTEKAAQRILIQPEIIGPLLNSIREDSTLKAQGLHILKACFTAEGDVNVRMGDIKDEKGDGVLHVAIKSMDFEFVKILLNQKVNVFQTDENQETAFYLLLKNGAYSLALEYAHEGRSGGYFIRNDRGESVLYQLCSLPLPDSKQGLYALKQCVTLILQTFPSQIENHAPNSVMHLNPYWHTIFRSSGALEVQQAPTLEMDKEAIESLHAYLLRHYSVLDAITLAEELRNNHLSYTGGARKFLNKNMKSLSSELTSGFAVLLGRIKFFYSAKHSDADSAIYLSAEQFMTYFPFEAWIKYKILHNFKELSQHYNTQRLLQTLSTEKEPFIHQPAAIKMMDVLLLGSSELLRQYCQKALGECRDKTWMRLLPPKILQYLEGLEKKIEDRKSLVMMPLPVRFIEKPESDLVGDLYQQPRPISQRPVSAPPILR